MKEIKIKSKKFGERIVTIDENDYEKIKGYSLSLFKNRDLLYVRTSWINGKRFLLHRYLTDCPDGMVVDHIDGNPLNNCRSNLRICTMQQNLWNSFKKQKNATCIYKGVQFIKNKYNSHIVINKKQILLGVFDSSDKAAIAYNIACIKYFGKFARPNYNIMMAKAK